MIEVKNLTKIFRKPIRKQGIKGMLLTLFSRKYEEIKAVNNLSFTINDGESVAYIGANGAGKSTTIKMMSGILTPTSGEVIIDGYHPYIAKERNKVLKNIGVVFGQKTQLWWDLPVQETFSLLKEVYEISDEDFDKRYKFLDELLGLSKFKTSPVRTLSLGQRMRADLAASLLHNPSILFLDEPTIGLDVLVKHNLIEAIKKIQKEYNTTLILTTHDMGDIADLCSRAIIIDEGSILYDGPLERIKDRFGDYRTLRILTNDLVNEKLIKEKFSGITSIDKEEDSYIISFDNGISKVNEILSYLFTYYKLKDLKISEISIEQVVEKIYETKQV